MISKRFVLITCTFLALASKSSYAVEENDFQTSLLKANYQYPFALPCLVALVG